MNALIIGGAALLGYCLGVYVEWRTNRRLLAEHRRALAAYDAALLDALDAHAVPLTSQETP